LDQVVTAESGSEKNCSSWGTPLFVDKYDGSVSFHTVSNAQCPLKDGASTSSAMNYQFDLVAQKVTIRYCDVRDVTAKLEPGEWSALQSALKSLRSIAPDDCLFSQGSNREFFLTMTRDGKSYPEAICQNNKISCIGSPSNKAHHFFGASGQAGLTRILLDLNRKHLP
jgi:hypothetical protein